MYLASNIKFLRAKRNQTQDELAKELNIKRSTLSGYENNVAEPDAQALISFSNYFQISIDTLLKVSLIKLSDSQLSDLEQGNDVYMKGTKLRILTKTLDKNNRENIELVLQKAKAGYTAGYNDPEYIANLPTFQLPFLAEDKSYRAFQIDGDSMLPIRDGSYVIAEFVQDWKLIKDGFAYIIVTEEDGIVFKIAYNEKKKKSKLLLKSLNPLFEPYEINLSEVKEVWRFVNYFSDQIPTEFEAEEYNFKYAINTIQEELSSIKKSVKKLEDTVNT